MVTRVVKALPQLGFMPPMLEVMAIARDPRTGFR